MVPNKGQWEGEFQFQVKMNTGALFIHEKGIKVSVTDFMERRHHADEEQQPFSYFWTSNVFMEWQGSNENLVVESSNEAPFYHNYFLGNQPQKWKSKIYPVAKSIYQNVYDGVNVEYNTTEQGLKYNYIVYPNANLDAIQWRWSGANKVEVSAHLMTISSKLGEIKESIPASYYFKNGKKHSVDISYVKKADGSITFDFDQLNQIDYDSLIIDPVLTFSTYSGSTSDNWGTSACPDRNDNAIGGGITFGSGYPTTSGSFMTDFQGGSGSGLNGRPLDISISKFSANGSSLIYATYIGGSSSNEIPCSMIVDGNNDLYIYGATGSDDFPVSSNAYQSSYGGGSTTTQNGINFTGSDIFVFKLSEDGTSMLASTYIGGSELDGLNIGQSALVKNYGDQFRGEINFDASGNPIIASSTRSPDFPMANAFDNSMDGDQDGVFVKFNPSLSTLLHSSYVGGSSYDALYGVRPDQNGNVFAVGGTMSSDLSATSNVHQSSNSGNQDGFVAKINNNNLEAITYLGTNQYDQTYFVDVDLDNFVYVFGQTDGGYPITTGLYNNSGGGQFIQKLDNNLQSSIWSTRVGGNNNGPQISPTAFLVSDCYDIYIAGWGGQTNATNNGVTTSTTNGFPVTSDAYQGSTNGSNFYIALYEPDMAALEYATFIGGQTSSANHVDGGTSRFDKRGIIYHSVCASCGSNINNGFSSTPGAFSETSQSSNCNMAVFKFDLSAITASFSTADNDICFPNGVQFTNNSSQGYVYEWNFGDGTSSFDQNPSHNYPGPGQYEVYLAVYDTTSCAIPDTMWMDIFISDPAPNIQISPDSTVCPGTQVVFSIDDIFNGSYTWGLSKGDFLTPNTVSNPVAIIDSTTEIFVNVSYACGNARDTALVSIFTYTSSAGPDSAICLGESAQLYVDEGAAWNWSPASTLNDPGLQNPTATPQQDTEYIVEITTSEGCTLHDTVYLEVDQDIPLPILPDTVHMCSGSSYNLSASDARSYLWSPNYQISNLTSQNVNVAPANDTMYYVELTNACGFNIDSSYVDVIFPDITASDDTIICPGSSVHLYAYDAVSFSWTPISSLVGENTSHVIAAPEINTDYIVAGTDQYGCVAYDTVRVSLYPKPNVQVSPDYYGFVGDTVQLSAEGDPGIYQWKPSSYLSCEYCTDPYALPPKNQTYTVVLTDSNGCSVSDQVSLFFDPILYVPNAFTPNDDGYNQTFGAEGGNIKEFTMYIFNRWGELIFEAHDMNTRWDGTYKGKASPMDVYVWKIFYTDVEDIRREMYGHVSLIR